MKVVAVLILGLLALQQGSCQRFRRDLKSPFAIAINNVKILIAESSDKIHSTLDDTIVQTQTALNIGVAVINKVSKMAEDEIMQLNEEAVRRNIDIAECAENQKGHLDDLRVAAGEHIKIAAGAVVDGLNETRVIAIASIDDFLLAVDELMVEVEKCGADFFCLMRNLPKAGTIAQDAAVKLPALALNIFNIGKETLIKDVVEIKLIADNFQLATTQIKDEIVTCAKNRMTTEAPPASQ